MKKTLLAMSLVAVNFVAIAQFTPNRIVVSQYGDGTAENLDGTATVPVILKEYKTTADNNPTYTISMPIADNDGGTGNKPLTGTFTATYEGLIALSPNGNYLSVVGYGDAPGVTATDVTLRSIAFVTATGSINSTTYVTSSANNLANPRCAITVDGTGFWAIGSNGGVRYKALGSAIISTSAVATTPAALRSITIFNNRIYESTNSSTGAHIGIVDNVLPTTNPNDVIALPGIDNSAATSPNQLAFLRIATGTGDPDLLYTTNNPANAGDIQKWVLTDGTWIQKGSVRISTTDSKSGISGITAQYEPATGKAYIYVITLDKLIKVTDANAATSIINITDNAPEILATAPANTMFRGVALTPGSSITLPVKLTSFTGEQQNTSVKLSWATASEQNNSHFDVLRSANREDFKPIGQVTGHGTTGSPVDYSFIDEHPISGIDYYQLNQVDFDGQSEKSSVIAVKTDLNQPVFTASLTDNDQLELQIYAADKTQARVIVSDISGRKLADTRLNLEQGYTKSSISLSGIQPGIYVASVAIGKQVQSLKFTK